jgi:hypothetical protein
MVVFDHAVLSRCELCCRASRFSQNSGRSIAAFSLPLNQKVNDCTDEQHNDRGQCHFMELIWDREDSNLGNEPGRSAQ